VKVLEAQSLIEVLQLTTTIDGAGYLNLRIPTQLAAGNVDIVIVLNPVFLTNASHPKYDFSDLIGRLIWQGDPVVAQRTLRDEWRCPSLLAQKMRLIYADL
jgi:hypothetical protein